MKVFTKLKVLALATSLMTLISCGSQAPMVEDVDLSTEQVDGDLIVSLSAELGIGNVVLPNATVPIFVPKIGKEIGTVSMYTGAGGANMLEIDINLSEATNLNLQGTTLPNGAAIPIVGGNAVLRIPVNNIEVYLSLADGVQALGVAIPIRNLDELGRSVGTTALMPVFSIDGVLGAAGIYTSSSAGQNGFALVADLSSKVDDIGLDKGMVMPQQQQAELKSYAPSRSAKKRIDRVLYKLHRKRAKLKM